jgi:hypothetical protein
MLDWKLDIVEADFPMEDEEEEDRVNKISPKAA